MKKEKVLENYFDSRMYSNREIKENIEETKKEFAKKIVNVDVFLNEFGVYVVTYYFESKENIFQKIMIKLKQRKKKKQTLLLQEQKINNRKENAIMNKKHKKTRAERKKEKIQARMKKYTGNQYGKYKPTKEYRPY